MTTTTTTILVTGSNQGLGFETARQLSKLPHVRLFISGRDSNRVQEALAKIKTAEGCQASVEKVIIDVSNDESIKAAVKEVESKLEGKALDVLINNSGAGFEGQIDTKGLRWAFEQTYAVNVFGAAIMADTFLPLLKKSTIEGGARILNISSGLGSITNMSDPRSDSKGHYLWAYGSSKNALNGITCIIAMKNPDIHVVSLDPGYNATNLNGYSGNMDPKDGVKVIVKHALGKLGKSPGFYSNFGELPW